MKLICPDPNLFSPEIIKKVKKSYDCYIKELSQENLNKIGSKYDIILTRFSKYIGKEIMCKNTMVKYILTPVTGLNHIDTKLAKRKKIKIIYLKDKKFLKNVTATAEHTWLLILAAIRKLIPAVNSVKRNKWTPVGFKGQELQGKNIGIIGFGRLGKKIGKYAKAFGMNVFFYDKYVKKKKGYKKISSLVSLIKKSNVISVNSSMTNETYHMINKKTLSGIKNNSIIINTSRGEIINSKDLCEILKKKKVYAAVDLIEKENSFYKKKSDPLINYAKKNKNLLITPHIGGFTEESVKKTDIFIFEKFKSLLTSSKS